MSTGMIIALIVIVAAVVVVAAVLTMRSRGPRGGRDLKRRFGPEYDRTLARHDGDAKATERELTERVERHGSLREQPLEPGRREQFEARWTAVQERFVDAPREAVGEADRLLAELAAVRGFPKATATTNSSPRSPSTTPTTSTATGASTASSARVRAGRTATAPTPRRCASRWSRPGPSSTTS